MPAAISKVKPEAPVREVVLPIRDVPTDWSDTVSSVVDLDQSEQDQLPSLQQMIQEQVQKLVAQEISRMGMGVPAELGVQKVNVTQGSVPLPMNGLAFNPPAKYKKHYRCDVAPNLKIQALDMSVMEHGERPQTAPIPGEWISFRFGHLYTSDDNTIAQIEWMRNRAMYSPDGQVTLGGNPSIYEDDGGDIYRCTAGCDFITASRNSWVAHMRSTHGLEVS